MPSVIRQQAYIARGDQPASQRRSTSETTDHLGSACRMHVTSPLTVGLKFIS